MPTGAGSPHPLLRHRLWGDRLYLARDITLVALTYLFGIYAIVDGVAR